jgi:hypothetical protein
MKTLFFYATAIMVFVLLLAPSLTCALEEQIQEIKHPTELDVGKKKEEKEKKRKFIVMPIPISNPTIGTGLGLSAMYLYKVDDASPTSNTMIGGFYTNSDSWVIGGKQTTYLKADKYRVNAVLGYMNLNIDFYGIGNDAGDKDESIPITQKGVFFMPDLLRRFFFKDLYFGLRYRVIKLETDVDLSNVLPGIGSGIPEQEIDALSSGLGIVSNYDSRDNKLNPYSGTLFEFDAVFPNETFGSDFNYQVYEATYNRYIELSRRQVLVFNAYGRFTFGDVPFWDLSRFGSKSELRGYVAGQYRDKMLLATQLEYRWQFYKRLGMVAFGGVGEVAPAIDEFNTDNLLPSIGAGIRYMVSEKNRVNVGIDFAVGKDSHAIYFRIGEAF